LKCSGCRRIEGYGLPGPSPLGTLKRIFERQTGAEGQGKTCGHVELGDLPSTSRLAVALMDALAEVLADKDLDPSTNAFANPSGLPGLAAMLVRAISRRLPRVGAPDHR
jgi:hypothetical protein